MRGTLFTHEDLSHPDGGISGTAALRDLDASNLAATEDRLAEILQSFRFTGTPNVAMTGVDLKRRYLLAERGPG